MSRCQGRLVWESLSLSLPKTKLAFTTLVRAGCRTPESGWEWKWNEEVSLWFTTRRALPIWPTYLPHPGDIHNIVYKPLRIHCNSQFSFTTSIHTHVKMRSFVVSSQQPKVDYTRNELLLNYVNFKNSLEIILYLDAFAFRITCDISMKIYTEAHIYMFYKN